MTHRERSLGLSIHREGWGEKRIGFNKMEPHPLILESQQIGWVPALKTGWSIGVGIGFHFQLTFHLRFLSLGPPERSGVLETTKSVSDLKTVVTNEIYNILSKKYIQIIRHFQLCLNPGRHHLGMYCDFLQLFQVTATNFGNGDWWYTKKYFLKSIWMSFSKVCRNPVYISKFTFLHLL